MNFTRYLPVFFSFTALCASSRSDVSAGRFLPKEVYPKIIDCSDSAKVNVYGSSAFRTRHARFLNELADSMRRVIRGLPDSGGKKLFFLSFSIDNTGEVNDVNIDCADSSDIAIKETLQARVLSWKFIFPPSFPLKVIQDIRITGHNLQGFFGRHRITVIIGLFALGVLLFY